MAMAVFVLFIILWMGIGIFIPIIFDFYDIIDMSITHELYTLILLLTGFGLGIKVVERIFDDR